MDRGRTCSGPCFLCAAKYWMTFLRRISVPAFPAVSDAQLREWLRLDGDVDQSTLDLLLGAAVDHIAALTGLYVVSADYSVTIPQAGRHSIPATNVTALPDGAAFDGSIITIDVEAAPATITVTAGWTSEEAIPEALRHAIAIYVGAAYDTRHDISDATFITIKRLCAPLARVAL